jgi:hypothetical protein
VPQTIKFKRPLVKRNRYWRKIIGASRQISFDGFFRALSTTFGDLFQRALFGRNEPSHVAAQEQLIGEHSDQSERRLPFDDVTHQRRIPDRFELVNVPESLERAMNHFIDKAIGTVELGDASDEALPDAEVTAFKRDKVAALEQSLHSARLNDAFG